MHWRLKSLGQRLISALPRSHEVNYVFQRHLTGSLPRTEGIAGTLQTVRDRLDVVRKHLPTRLEGVSTFEFGAGPDLMKPLILYGLGVGDQTLVDIRRLVKPQLVRGVVEKLRNLSVEGSWRRPPTPPADMEDDLDAALKETYEITYCAPCDARRSGLTEGSVNLVQTTNTLEHVPREDLREIHEEAWRVLSEGGVLAHRIDYRDHYSYADPDVGPYHFLRFSEEEWERWNPPLQYQNRMRHREYTAMFEDVGFEIMHVDPEEPSIEERERLEAMGLAPPFDEMALGEVGIQSAFIVAKKTADGGGSR